MRTKRVWTLLLIVGCVPPSWAQQRPVWSPSNSAQRLQAGNGFGRLPMMFAANRGQVSSEAKFVARGAGYSAFLTASGIVISLRSQNQSTGNSAQQGPKQRTSIFFNLIGANQNSSIEGEDPQPGHLNYFVGNNPKRWRTNVPIYSKVRYRNIYPGIDLVYYGNNQKLEYDFEVSPTADPNLIQFEIKGASNINVDSNGNLVLHDGTSEIHFQSPTVYQQINGQRMLVNGTYELKDQTHIAFQLAHYDPSRPLVIDPVLAYCTYLGGSGDDEAQALAIDSTGAIYLAGYTDSSDFPGTLPAGYTGEDVFVAKLDPTATTLIYGDYIGGSGLSFGYGLALDGSNNAYVVGNTSAPDFPTASPYQSTLAGNIDGFLTKVSADGSTLLYSTYLGGTGMDEPTSVAVDSTNEAYVAGWTLSTDFPVSSGAYQTTVSANQGSQYGAYGFLTKFSADGQSLGFSTYLGGSSQVVETCSGSPCWPNPSSTIQGVALDASSNAYVAGVTDTYDFPVTVGAYLTTNSTSQNMPVSFISKFDNSGNLSYSTYFYGSDGAETDIDAIAVDSTGSAYVTGATLSTTAFPLTSTSICDPAIYGAACGYAFVTKLNSTGTGLSYSTFLGPNNMASPYAIALDGSDDAYVLAVNYTGQFTTVNGIEAFTGSDSNLLLVEIDPLASMQLFATYFGGATAGANAGGLAVDSSGNIYAAGSTPATDIPTTSGSYQTALDAGDDAFLFKITQGPGSSVSPSPGFVQFSSQSAGQLAQSQAILVRNMGSSPLLVSSIRATGDFSESNTCGVSVTAAGSCSVEVSFTPTAPGTRTGSVVIEDNAPGSPHVINLQGDAVGSFATFNAASLRFPNLALGSSSATQIIALTNSGNAPLDISSVQLAGNFTQSNNCPGSLGTGAACQFEINFKPISTGAQAGSLTVASDAFNSQETLPLSGTGVDFEVTTSRANVQVAPGATATYDLRIAPVGGAFSYPVQLSCSGLPADTACKLSQNSVTPGASAVSVTLTLATTTSSSNSFRSSRRLIYGTWIPLSGFGLFGLILVVPNARPRRWCARLFLPFIIALVAFSSGCAGGTGTTPSSGTDTPAGTYHITVMAKSGALRHSLPVTLTVE